MPTQEQLQAADAAGFALGADPKSRPHPIPSAYLEHEVAGAFVAGWRRRMRQELAEREYPDAGYANFIDVLLAAAKRHGAECEPDHEVGDLQELLRTCWQEMAVDQRVLVVSAMRDFIKEWG